MATITAQQVIDRARLSLNDTVATYRWSDATLLTYLDDGLRVAIAERVDVTLDADGALVTFDTVDDVADTMTLPAEFLSALAHYVAYRAFTENDPDRENVTRAEMHRGLFLQMLRGA